MRQGKQLVLCAGAAAAIERLLSASLIATYARGQSPLGGEGATAREVLRHKSVEKLVMVDIDKVGAAPRACARRHAALAPHQAAVISP
jgi:hypothetical protein